MLSIKTPVSVIAATLLALGTMTLKAQSTLVGDIATDFNVVNGAATYAVPIAVAPGRGGGAAAAFPCNTPAAGAMGSWA